MDVKFCQVCVTREGVVVSAFPSAEDIICRGCQSRVFLPCCRDGLVPRIIMCFIIINILCSTASESASPSSRLARSRAGSVGSNCASLRVSMYVSHVGDHLFLLETSQFPKHQGRCKGQTCSTAGIAFLQPTLLHFARIYHWNTLVY